MILTLDIPDTLADQLRAEAEARGEDLNHYAVAKLEAPVDTDYTDEETDDDLITALRQGLADVNGGNSRTFEQVDATVDAAFAARRERLQAKAA